MKPKKYRISKSHITKDGQQFFLVEVKTELGWDEISKPMPLDRAEKAFDQLVNPHVAPIIEFAPIVGPDDVPQQSVVSSPIAAS